MIVQSAYDELKAKFDALMRDFEASKANFEAMEKIVNDRDRQARGDRRQIEHFEQECRRQRMEIKELQKKLNDVETQKVNVEKEKEQLVIDVKSCQKRLENEKARSDTYQVQLTQKELELQRSKDVLSAANKQIKMLDQKLKITKEKKTRLKEIVKEYANINKGGNTQTSPPKKVVKQLSHSQSKTVCTDEEEALFGITVDAAGQDEEMQELAQDGEILDDEVDPIVLRQNEMEMKARNLLQLQSSLKSSE